MANNSQPEILIDDADKASIQVTGNWRQGKLGRCYGTSLLHDDAPDTSRAVRFRLSVPRTRRYDVYVYSPEVPKKSSRLAVTVQTGKARKAMFLQPPREASDWLHAGTFELATNANNYLEISNQQADGVTVADAVLLVPK